NCFPSRSVSSSVIPPISSFFNMSAVSAYVFSFIPALHIRRAAGFYHIKSAALLLSSFVFSSFSVTVSGKILLSCRIWPPVYAMRSVFPGHVPQEFLSGDRPALSPVPPAVQEQTLL